jgi:hypothetical protein
MYLPATFIYHDLKKCGFADSLLKKYHPTPDFQQALPSFFGQLRYEIYNGAGSYVFSIFLCSTYYRTIYKYPADGFSLPYQFCISFGMMLYAFLGLFILRKTLLRFFPDKIAAITLLVITLRPPIT